MELKPCPFCGGAVSMIQLRAPLPDFEDVDKGDYEVFCAKCNAATVFFKATLYAYERWNRRADDAVEDLQRELKDCRNELCLRCGEYKRQHLGACDGCRWKDGG